jgi:superfamily II DNA or RNA helicase/HKD family nuclease
VEPVDVADRLAFHLGMLIERAIEALPEDDRSVTGAHLARQLIDLLAGQQAIADMLSERPVEPLQILTAVRGRRPDGTIDEISSPLIPLLDTTLLTNAPGEPRVGHQIHTEIESADRIDVIMAFIRRSGIRPFIDVLQQHVNRGRPLRFLTTAYTGSTEPDALKMLLDLGAHVKVSYDTSATRLHAKAWLFHRESGLSTAYVGSSNLTHSAQVSGLEWNVRVSGARNRHVIEKISAVFDSYWNQPDFEPFDRERLISVARTGADSGVLLSPIEVRLEPFQERLLEQLQLSRQRGYHRNLLVSATGTGKTVMAAVDFARLRSKLPRSRLLFVAHRAEILQQSRATFAQVLRDGNFGELWVAGQRPEDFENVFASIQSLSVSGLDDLDPTHFDVVIVDEFHHAAAATYTRLLERLLPQELLGLTATPERSDGVSVLQWFDDRIAAELRLWDAIDQHRLVPFAYFGVGDNLDLRSVPWRRGTGYDTDELTRLITSTDIWARSVLQQFLNHIGASGRARALGFCVSVEHARYMARVFNGHGVIAVAVVGDTDSSIRREALAGLQRGEIQIIFSVDIFNEGVDLPSVDTLLMLRPTDSPLLFLQQLGRGLRKSEGKSLCTVLDFVGQHRKEFRYDRRLQALLGGSRAAVMRQVETGFPFLPAGCHMELDRVSTQRVLESIRRAVPDNWLRKVAELRDLAQEKPNLRLLDYLQQTGLDLEDVYANNRSWSALREAAGLSNATPGPHEEVLRRACGRLLHVDDLDRLDRWTAFVQQTSTLETAALPEVDRRLLTMLLTQVLDQLATRDMSLDDGVRLLRSHPQVCSEMSDLFVVLRQRILHVSDCVETLADVPLRRPSRYTRHEILAAAGETNGVKTRPWREGVFYSQRLHADICVFTLDKTKGQFSPTTRYRDYAISRELIHWESQSGIQPESPTGLRYQEHEARGSHILLFARLRNDERAFYFLGPASYVSHQGEFPMSITWRLHSPLPGDLFAAFAAAVA